MADTVSAQIPTELYKRLEDAAKRNGTTVEVELKRCLVRGLPKKAGRPPKQFHIKWHDDLLDLLLMREVLKHPKGKASETTKRLKAKEPFKDKGDLRRRYNRLQKGIREAGGDPKRAIELVIFKWPDGAQTELKLDSAFEIFSKLKSFSSDVLANQYMVGLVARFFACENDPALMPGLRASIRDLQDAMEPDHRALYERQQNAFHEALDAGASEDDIDAMMEDFHAEYDALGKK